MLVCPAPHWLQSADFNGKSYWTERPESGLELSGISLFWYEGTLGQRWALRGPKGTYYADEDRARGFRSGPKCNNSNLFDLA